MSHVSKKGGLSKQQRRRLHLEQASRPPVRPKHAGLSPSLYTSLHNIRRPTAQPLTILGRQRLLAKISHLEARIKDLEKSIEAATDLLEVFCNEDDEWVRAQIIRMTDSISSSLADARQRLIRLKTEEETDSIQLSLQVAYEIQQNEVRSHDNWIGRLDQPRQPQPQPQPRLIQPRLRFPPSERNLNLPTPIRPAEVPGPSNRPHVFHDLERSKMQQREVENCLNTAAVVTPVAADGATAVEKAVCKREIFVESENEDDKAVKAEEEEEEEDEVEPLEHVTRCVHHRLHRCGATKDLADLKKRLLKSCAKTCGKQKRPSLRKLTLYKPLPQKLKVNLDGQFQLCEHEGEVIELPTISLRCSPRVEIAASERAAAEEAMTELLHNSTIPIVNLEDTDSDIIEIVPNLNTEQIHDLQDNDEFLRHVAGVGSVGGGSPVGGLVALEDFHDSGVLRPAIPNPSGLTPSLESPRPPRYYGSCCCDFECECPLLPNLD